jgi:hypothetical protein
MFQVYGICPPAFPLLDVIVALNTKLVELPQRIVEILPGFTATATPIIWSGVNVTEGVGDSTGEVVGVIEDSSVVVDEPVSVLPQATIPNRARQLKISISI